MALDASSYIAGRCAVARIGECLNQSIILLAFNLKGVWWITNRLAIQILVYRSLSLMELRP